MPCTTLVLCVFELSLNVIVPTAPEPVSQTKNVGSIKAMFASRAQAKAVNNHFLPGDNVEKSANSK